MDVKKLILGMVGIMICAVMIGGTTLPIVADVTAESDTYTNVGYFDMEKFTADDTVSFSWSYTNPDEVLVNDEVVPLPFVDETVSIALSTKGATRLNIDHNSLSYYSAGTFVNAGVDNPEFSLTYEGGTLSATNGTDSHSTAVGELFVIVNNGNFVMKKASVPAYANSDTEFCAYGLTYFGSSRMPYAIWGTFDNYTNITSTSATIENFTKNYEVATNHVDLYLLESFTFDATLNNISKQVVYSYFAIEKEVSADRTDPMAKTPATMLNVLPLVAIAGLVMAGIYVFISRK